MGGKGKTREEHLRRLEARPADAWGELEKLYSLKKDSPALRLLLDLAACPSTVGEEFLARVRALDDSSPARQARIVGIPSPGPSEKTAKQPVTKRPVKKSKADPDWAQTGQSRETIRQAKALGMSPRNLIKNQPSPSQKWKAPVRIWVQELYEKRFGVSKDGDLDVPF